MQLKFSKMHALGNDFVVVDVCRDGNVLTKEIVQRLSDRHFGIGCDQLLALAPASVPKADFDYWIFNGDGVRVYQCGNGARCLAHYVFHQRYHAPPSVRFYTGRDRLDVTRCETGLYRLTLPSPQLVRLNLEIYYEDQPIVGDYIDVGNPHFVIEALQFSPEKQAEVARFLQQHDQFPYSVNVGFAEAQTTDEIRLRVFERGAGETLACGSGAIAAAIAAHQQGRVGNTVSVQQAGGRLEINWTGHGAPVVLTGPACHVFDGEITL